MTAASKRVRDPVHGLIVFEGENPIDQLAWALTTTREMQRLRRIRQLGVSEFTFPGAVHTRFSHSIGVFHVARALMKVIEREIGHEFKKERAEVALIAALLHDIGHGPFSHTFEGVQKDRGVKKRHEAWTAELIRNKSGEVFNKLEDFRAGFSSEVANLLSAEDPVDIYHAVVSSSFDADRLDYLRRDRFMTGTGAGAIDFDWLMDNLRVAPINLEDPDEAEDESESRKVATFCLNSKALPAAEQFLLARYTLHVQVYFHKTTRCAEKMVGKLLSAVAVIAGGGEGISARTGLPENHALIRFFAKSGETAENYLALDDAVVFGSLGLMAEAEDPVVRDMAVRLRDRRLYKTLDVGEVGADHGRQTRKIRKIEEMFKEALVSGSVIKDDGAAISIYSEVGGDDERMHKRLHIFDGRRPVEITKQSKMIDVLREKKSFTRFYFENECERDKARAGGAKNG